MVSTPDPRVQLVEDAEGVPRLPDLGDPAGLDPVVISFCVAPDGRLAAPWRTDAGSSEWTG